MTGVAYLHYMHIVRHDVLFKLSKQLHCATALHVLLIELTLLMHTRICVISKGKFYTITLCRIIFI